MITSVASAKGSPGRPLTVLPPAASAPASTACCSRAAHSGSGRQSSSVKHTTSPRAARTPAFRAIAGYGRHGVLHEQHFFELAGDLTVEVEFLLSDAQAETLLEALRREQVRVFYAKVAAEFGMIEGRD